MRRPERKLMAGNPIVENSDSQVLEYEAYRNDVEDFDIDQEFNELFDGETEEAVEIPNEAVTQETPPKDPVTFNPAETGIPGAVDAVLSFVKDVGKGALETPRQALSGVAESVNEALELAEDVGESLIDIGLPSSFLQIVNEKGDFDVKLLSPEETTQAREAGDIELFQFPEGADPESVTGTLVRESSKFLIPFFRTVKAVKAIKGTAAAATTFGEASIASSVASAVVQDPHEDRLSAYLNTIPGIAAVVPDYLADNDPANESTWEGRIKNAIEDAGIGTFAESLFRVFKFYKAQRKTTKLAAAEADPMDRATLKEQARESAEQQADEITLEDLSLLGDPDSKETFITADVAEQRIKEAEKRIAKEESAVITPEVIPPGQTIEGSFFNVSGLTQEFPTTDIFHGDKERFIVRGDISDAEGAETNIIFAVEDIFFRDPDIFANIKKINPEAAKGLQKIQKELIKAVQRADKRLTDVQPGDLDSLLSRKEILDEEILKFSSKMTDAEFSFIFELEEKGLAALFVKERGIKLRPQKEGAAAESPPAQIPEKLGAPFESNKIFINMAKIDTAEDVKQLIQDVANADAKAIDKKRGGKKKTLGKMLEESDEEFIAIKDLIGRDPGPMTAAEALAARKILNSSAEKLGVLAKLVNKGNATSSKEYMFRRALSIHYAIQSEVLAARTETARALRSWAIPVSTDKQRGQIVNELIGTGGGAKSTKEMAQSIVDNLDNPTGLNGQVRNFSVATGKKAAFQVWMDGILSGPATQVVNILGNSITASYMIPESIANAAVSKVFYEGEISYLEATAKSYGMVKGLRDGFRMLAHGQKAGEFKELSEQFEQFVKFEGVGENNITAEAFGLTNSGAFGQGIDYLGKFFNISAQGINVKGIPVYPGLNTMDKLFKSMGYRMELEALAIRQGISEGLEGDALAARALDITNNPPANLVADSIEAGHYQTFTNEFGETGKAGMQFLRRIPGGRLVVTFVRTPTNIMKFSFKRTPLAILARSVRADIAAGGARGAQAWGRIGLGSMIMLGIADMTLDGTITGPGPADSRLRSNLMLTGWRPFSVKIGEDYFPYNRLDPVGNLFAYGSGIGEIINNMDDPDAEFAVATGVMGFTQNLASKSYLSGIFDFMAAIDPSNPVKGPEQWVQRFSTSLIPKSSLLRSITRAIDPTIRITQTAEGDTANGIPAVDGGTQLFLEETLNQVRANVPFFSSDLPARVDLWGEDISRASHLGTAFDLLSPIYASEGKFDAVEQILVNNKVPIGHISKDIQGVKLTGQEQHDYGELAGKPLKKFLNKLVKTPGFKAMTDGPEGGKSNTIQDHVRRFRNKARNDLIKQNLSLQNRINMKGDRDRKKLLGDPASDPSPGPAQLPVVEGGESTQSIEAILGGR